MTDRKINILLVEDNRSDYLVIQKMLSDVREDFGHELHWAENFSKGIEVIGEKQIDIAILDLSLPDSQGLDVYFGFRAMAPQTPVVLVSALKDPGMAKKAVQAGAQDFLSKSDLSGVLLYRALTYAMERFEIYSRVENSREQLERSTKVKSEVLINLASEIHAPLYDIIRSTEQALSHSLPDSPRLNIATVKESAQVLLSLVNDIVDFNRIDSGSLDLNLVDFRLREYLARVVSLISEHAEQKNLRIDILVDDEVPDLLRADVDRIGQVLRNFIVNFVAFAKPDSVIVLKVGTEKLADQNCRLQFSVLLQGGDIPLEKQKLIFESFAQADASSARKYGSIGLGLAVSSRLVELMSGRVWVENDSSKGASFHFTGDFQLQSVGSRVRKGSSSSA